MGLLAVSPAGRHASLDGWIRTRLRARAPREASSVPALWLFAFRFQVGVVYFFAGMAKLQPDWLLHGQPLAIWLSSQTDLPLLGPLFAVPGAPLAMSWAGFLFDTTIVLWLSLRRTRPYAYALVVGFPKCSGICRP